MSQKKVLNQSTVKGLTFKEIKQAISVVYGKLANFDFKDDPKGLYRTTRLVEKLRPEAIFIEDKTKELFEKYAVENKETNVKSIPADKLKDFRLEEDKLLAVVSQVEIHPVEFNMIKSVGLTPNDITNLGRLILEPTDI